MESARLTCAGEGFAGLPFQIDEQLKKMRKVRKVRKCRKCHTTPPLSAKLRFDWWR